MLRMAFCSVIAVLCHCCRQMAIHCAPLLGAAKLIALVRRDATFCTPLEDNQRGGASPPRRDLTKTLLARAAQNPIFTA